MTLLRVKRTRVIDGHLLHLSCGILGMGHVPELCCAVVDPTVGSMHPGGPNVLTQRGKDRCAAAQGRNYLRAAKGSGSLHVFIEIPQRLEKSFCAKIQSI